MPGRLLQTEPDPGVHGEQGRDDEGGPLAAFEVQDGERQFDEQQDEL
jgi:hypothetical protein